MASEQELVRDAWLAARKGNLCALSECKAWALREVWREQKGPKARRILRVKICIASKCIFSSVNMTFFKSEPFSARNFSPQMNNTYCIVLKYHSKKIGLYWYWLTQQYYDFAALCVYAHLGNNQINAKRKAMQKGCGIMA